MKARCCPECFDDRGLRDNIFPSLNPTRGKCSYCGTKNVALVEPRQLSTYFEMLVNVYEPNEKGKSLVEWMKEDWGLFSHRTMDIAHSKELLGEILDNGDIVRKPFAPSPLYTSTGLIEWETLRDEMLHKNRWFLDVSIDKVRLDNLFELLLAGDLPSRWYRARLQSADDAYPIEMMGPPPHRIASHGRANPAGIAYLYLGSTPETAASEIRPHTGELACVADFAVSQPLRAVDLRNPRKVVSPFVLEDSTEIGQLRADIPLLERLGEELTRPVVPAGAAIEYIPSQYLCEFIKTRRHEDGLVKYDGVVYRSSVSDGYNLVLFDPSKAKGGTVSKFRVKRVSVDVESA